ncbi:MAG: hypothetical protein GH150_06015 [Hadesarchaea archaeon]|nr:hypothetical protein [Hadesarchaea archaeon]
MPPHRGIGHAPQSFETAGREALDRQGVQEEVQEAEEPSYQAFQNANPSPIKNVADVYGKTSKYPLPDSYNLGRNSIALPQRSSKVMFKEPVATKTIIKAITAKTNFMAFLIIVPTSRPITKGMTIGMTQAYSGGIGI